MYKYIYLILTSFIFVTLQSLPFVFTEQDTKSDYTFELLEVDITQYEALQHTSAKIDFRLTNDFDFNIKDVTLKLDLYEQDVFVKTVTVVIPIEVLNHSYVTHTYLYKVDNQMFDSFTIQDVSVTHYGFFRSYSPSLFFAGLYHLVLLFGLFILTKHQSLFLSDINGYISNHKVITSLIVFVIPSMIFILSYVGKFHLLSSIYGWTYIITTLLFMPLTYGMVVLYNKLTDNKL